MTDSRLPPSTSFPKNAALDASPFLAHPRLSDDGFGWRSEGAAGKDRTFLVRSLGEDREDRADRLQRLILLQWQASVPAAIWPIVVTAVLVGHRRVTVDDLGMMHGMAVRTLRGRLRLAGCAPPKTFLDWTMILTTAWRLEVLQLQPKRVAYLAGYGGAAPWSALSEYLHRHLDVRTRQLGKPGDFARLLTQSVSKIAGPPPTSR